MSVRIGIGTGLGATLSPAEYWRWIDYCEESGIDSIWCSDQLLGTTIEPMTMLAALAARTSRVKFGTNALVLAFRDPIVVAKEFAAIQHLSGGRLFPVLGVGAEIDPYWEATGTSPKGRGARCNEAIELIRLLLEQDEVEFAGEHYRYRGPGVEPRPIKKIPLWIGGNSKAAIRRTAELGDGWLGSFAGSFAAGEAKALIEAGLAENGRTIEPDHYGMSLLVRFGSDEDPAVEAVRQRLAKRLAPAAPDTIAESLAVGAPEAVTQTLKRYVSQGMSKFVVSPMASTIDELMEQTRILVNEVIPQVEDRKLA